MPSAVAKKRKAPARKEHATVYFGPDRLVRASSRAASLGKTLSGYVCDMVDLGLELPPELQERFRALATVRGTTVAKLLTELVAKALR